MEDMTTFDTITMPWEEVWNEHLGKTLYRKNLIADPETGVEIRVLRYPAGVVNTRHVHACAHGIYVLEGTLVTHAGSFGKGHFVWFPAGIEMEHGATRKQMLRSYLSRIVSSISGICHQGQGE